MNTKKVRVRIAPSPTGNLHVGTARTALFNELFARQQGGAFIVRIEDTDKARSTAEYEKNIIEGLQWLGITWDEGPDKKGKWGPYRQSERTETYTTVLQQLLDNDQAYKDGEAIRLKVPPQTVTFQDIVRGKVTVHTDTFGGDFVIARTTHDPLYHLAVVVDDALMEITHVIRGEDHISNTAKHILIQRAAGYTQPIYAHLPLLLDAHRKKLSKRSGETSLLAYRDQGYLPEAMLNFLALLGWHGGDDRELYTHTELQDAFKLEQIQKSGAIFSVEKLQAMNKEYIRQLKPQELLAAAAPFLKKAGVREINTEHIIGALMLERERVATLAELPEAIGFVLPTWQPNYEKNLLVWRKSDGETTAKLLQKLAEKIAGIAPADFTEKKLSEVLLAWIDEHKLGRGDTLWPLRIALTGREHSPGPFEIAALLGKDATVERIQFALQKFL